MENLHKIAVLSDTHSTIREDIIEKIKECELILHGGDIADAATISRLQAIAPTFFVRGNADRSIIEDIPEERVERMFGYTFYMIHNKKMIRNNLDGVDFVIYGHSHKYDEMEKDGIVYLNPGSCGPRRFLQPVTMAILTINESNHTFDIEKIDCTPILQTQNLSKVSKKDMDRLIIQVIKLMQQGIGVEDIATKLRTKEELVRQILQIYTTHPGIDVDGIMNRMDIWGK